MRIVPRSPPARGGERGFPEKRRDEGSGLRPLVSFGMCDRHSTNVPFTRRGRCRRLIPIPEKPGWHASPPPKSAARPPLFPKRKEGARSETYENPVHSSGRYGGPADRFYPTRDRAVPGGFHRLLPLRKRGDLLVRWRPAVRRRRRPPLWWLAGELRHPANRAAAGRPRVRCACHHHVRARNAPGDARRQALPLAPLAQLGGHLPVHDGNGAGRTERLCDGERRFLRARASFWG